MLSPGDQTILDRRIRRRVTPGTIDEHRLRPFGPHSPELVEVLHFLRRSPDPELPSYVVLSHGDPPGWSIGVRPPERAAPATTLGEPLHATAAEAEHAVFLRRLADYGLLPAEQRPAGHRLDEPHGLMGYLDAVSVAPGESVQLHVGSTTPRWRAEVVRLLSAEMRPEGPPLREEPVTAIASVDRESLEQHTAVGSYVRTRAPHETLDPAAGLAVVTFAMATLPGDGVQALVSRRCGDGTAGWSLRLDERGAPQLWLATAAGETLVGLEEALVRGCWYVVAAAIDPAEGSIGILARPAGTRAANRAWTGRGPEQRATAALRAAPVATSAPLLLGCGWLERDVQPRQRLDGRLAHPTLLDDGVHVDELPRLRPGLGHPALAASWDFGAGITAAGIARPSHVEDVGPNGWHGRCVNHPQRGVTGPGWDGTQSDLRHAREQYAAAHFHRDDMTDCGWTPQAELALPEDLPSGVYAARLTAEDQDGGDLVDHVPFFVRPPRGRATAPLLLVVPTNSYLAYANDHVGVDSPRVQMMVRRALTFDERDRFRHHHRELGASLYEGHPDGTGNCYSSWRRPILTMRPHVRTHNGRAWQFTGDMQIVDWLDRQGRECDVVSDRDLHDEGAELLARYACVMTGTHPEYVTGAVLDALGDYVDGGGRLVYMGGNGLYWVTAYDPEDDQVIEIRRSGGSQAWQALPGETHLSFSGEPGGLWRSRGRAPQKTTGVGFVAAGLVDAGAGYARRLDPGGPAGWVLAGVDAGEFGWHGTSGGAAGLEIDATDPELGTPPATVVVASSAGLHPDDMLEARENYGMTLAAPGGARNPRVRSDMVLVPAAGGGGVFSTGSIAWAGALAHDADVSAILANVLDRFLSGAPLLDSPVDAHVP